MHPWFMQPHQLHSSLSLFGHIICFTVGMPIAGELFFMYATMLIAIPTGVKVFNWVTTMFRGSMTFETPMLLPLHLLFYSQLVVSLD